MSLFPYSPVRAAIVARRFVDEFETYGREHPGFVTVTHIVKEEELLPDGARVDPVNRTKVDYLLFLTLNEYLDEWSADCSIRASTANSGSNEPGVWQRAQTEVGRAHDTRETSIKISVTMSCQNVRKL